MEAVPALLASALPATRLGVHLFVGGRDIARPLRLAADIPDEVRGGAWPCRHPVSAAPTALAVLPLLGWAMGGPPLLATAAVLAAAFATVGLAGPARLGLPLRPPPQGLPSAPVAIAAGAAALA